MGKAWECHERNMSEMFVFKLSQDRLEDIYTNGKLNYDFVLDGLADMECYDHGRWCRNSTRMQRGEATFEPCFMFQL